MDVKVTKEYPGGITAKWIKDPNSNILSLSVRDERDVMLGGSLAPAPNALDVVTSDMNDKARSLERRSTQSQSTIDQYNSYINDPSAPQEQKNAAIQARDSAIASRDADLAKAASIRNAARQITSDQPGVLAEIKTEGDAAEKAANPPPPTPSENKPAPDPKTGTTTEKPFPSADQPSAAPAPAGPTPAATAASAAPASQNLNDDDQNTPSQSSSETQSNVETPKTVNTVGKRLKNPLGALSSYTYQLSLYMITPTGYEAFKKSGGNLSILNTASINATAANPDLKVGAYLIAQSGGINADEERAPSFNFDYEIDNLSYIAVGLSEAGSSAAQYNFTFTIKEPYGFSFITNLRRASEAILKSNQIILKKRQESANNSTRTNGTPVTNTNSSPSDTVPTLENPTKNFFLLGVRFYGYDASGRIVKGNTRIPVTNINNELTGETVELDPGNPTESLFVKYFPIVITEVQSKLEGKETTYNIKAQSSDQLAFENIRGVIQNPVEIEGSTVGELLESLASRLTKEQEALQKANGLGYLYSISYASVADEVAIKPSTIVSSADTDKYKWKTSGAKSTKDSNSSTETGKAGKPNNTKRTMAFGKGIPIIQAIDQILAQSSYLENALKSVYTTDLEPNAEKGDNPKVEKTTKEKPKWYNCTPNLKNIRWNNNTASWTYDIEYILNVYDTPVIDTAYANAGTDYYGPFKRYEYWYTGTNTEVIRYSQELNNNYFTTFIASNFQQKAPEGNEAGKIVPIEQNQSSGMPSQGKQGLAMEAQNSFITSLFDPKAAVTATVEILGDPDWLTDSIPRKQEDGEVSNKYYGSDGNQINIGAGQPFFEIDFREAIDYVSSDDVTINGKKLSAAPGTLAINDSIQFWADPKRVSNGKGLVYRLNKCTSTFSQGVFKQKLEATIHNPPTNESQEKKEAAQRPNETASNNQSGPNKGNANATTTNKGMPTAKPNPAVATTPRVGTESLRAKANKFEQFGKGATGTRVGSDSFKAKVGKLSKATNNFLGPPET